MKLLTQTTQTPRLETGDLDSFIEAKSQEFTQKAILAAQLDANNRKPELSGDKLTYFIEPIVTNYQSLYPECERRLQANLQKQHGEIELMQGEEQLATLQQDRDRENAERERLQSTRPAEVPYGALVTVLFAVLALLLVYGAECVYQILSMQVLGGSMIAAILMGVGVTIALTAIAALSQIWIEKLPTRLLRGLANVGVVILIFGALCALAKLRDQYFATLNHTDSFFWKFVLLNTGLFIASALIVQLIMKKTPMLKMILNDWKVGRKIAKLNKRIKEIDTAIAELKRTLPERLKNRLGLMSEAKRIRQKIQACYEQTVATYKHTNSTRRGEIPDCFITPTPPLHFPDTEE